MSANSYAQITCRCGYQGDFDEFIHTPVGGLLPKDTFQCPKCRRAIRRKHGPSKLHPTGWVEPGPVSLVEVEAVL